MSIGAMPAIMGSILIAAGILQVFFQMWRAPRHLEKIADRIDAATSEVRQSRGRSDLQRVDFSSGGFKIQTAYPGMTMVCVGALLLMLGWLAD